ncbi:MAG TPA: UbiA-like protein EboC [Sphingobacteriaceae bacterium]|nr:UbiA-like protein EboC [Sphingobacteriaceae bacterium]
MIFLKLARPANLVTAVSDILAGIAISGILLTTALDWELSKAILLLSLSTIGLYGGGIVFNDVFDIKVDRIERPERPLPRGLISLQSATIYGILLLALGVIFAFLVNQTAGIIAILTSISALVYDKWGKNNTWLGPPNMGLCRGFNLLLGVSILPEMVFELWYLAFIPIIYISAITMISRGEVSGSSKTPLQVAAFLYALVISMIVTFSYFKSTLLTAIIFLLLFAYFIFKPLRKAIVDPSALFIRTSVKAGVIALILMNASWAAAAGSFPLALIITALLPFSMWLSKHFSVT